MVGTFLRHNVYKSTIGSAIYFICSFYSEKIYEAFAQYDVLCMMSGITGS